MTCEHTCIRFYYFSCKTDILMTVFYVLLQLALFRVWRTSLQHKPDITFGDTVSWQYNIILQVSPLNDRDLFKEMRSTFLWLEKGGGSECIVLKPVWWNRLYLRIRVFKIELISSSFLCFCVWGSALLCSQGWFELLIFLSQLPSQIPD